MTEGQNIEKQERVCDAGSAVRSREKRLHEECLSRAHSCHENGDGERERGGEEAQNEYCHHSLRRI